MDTEIRNNTQQYKDDEIVLDLRGLFIHYYYIGGGVF